MVKLAGVPQRVLDTARLKLEELEAAKSGAGDFGSTFGGSTSYAAESAAPAVSEEPAQLSFFSFAPNPVVDRLKALNLMEITPSQAFRILEELKEAAEK